MVIIKNINPKNKSFLHEIIRNSITNKWVLNILRNNVPIETFERFSREFSENDFTPEINGDLESAQRTDSKTTNAR